MSARCQPFWIEFTGGLLALVFFGSVWLYLTWRERS